MRLLTYEITLDSLINDAVIDQEFYRKYKKMDPKTKDKIRKMIDLWGDN